MKWGIAFVTIVYWTIAIFVAGFAMVLQGDCGAGTTQPETAQCNHNATIAGLIVIIGAAVLYVAAWRRIRKRW